MNNEKIKLHKIIENSEKSKQDLKEHYLNERPKSILKIYRQNDKPTEKKVIERQYRRSKYDCSGRMFSCKICNKSYLSYSALYTHGKVKHQTINEQPRVKRKRLSYKVNSEITNNFYNSENNIKNITIHLEKKDIPTPIVYGFDSIYKRFNANDEKNIKIMQTDSFFKKLCSKHEENLKNIRYNLEFLNKCVSLEKSKLQIYSSEEISNKAKKTSTLEECQVTCDDVFVEYLHYVSLKITPNYYIKVLEFIFIYREYMNLIGYKIKKSKEISLDLIKNEKEDKGNYCSNEPPEYIPECSNGLILEYFSRILTKLSLKEMIDLIYNFCIWIYQHGYTKVQIELDND